MRGKTGGYPDYVVGDSIFDYKTGEVYEEEREPGERRVKEATDGTVANLWLPDSRKCRILATGRRFASDSGGRLAVPLTEGNCTQAAMEALDLLEAYNRAVGRLGAAASDIARPSPEICRWCPLRRSARRFGKLYQLTGLSYSTGRRSKASLGHHPQSLSWARWEASALGWKRGTVSEPELRGLAPLD